MQQSRRRSVRAEQMIRPKHRDKCEPAEAAAGLPEEVAARNRPRRQPVMVRANVFMFNQDSAANLTAENAESAKQGGL